MAKLFNLDLQEMSQDIIDMGLLKEANFKINESAGINDSIIVKDQSDEPVINGVQINS